MFDSGSFLCLLVALLMLAWSTWQDLKDFTIPNIATFSGMFAGLIISGLMSGERGLLHALIGLGIGFLIGGLTAYVTKMGLGDVLLYAALGSLLGASSVIAIFALTKVLLFLRTMPRLFRKRGPIKIAVAPYITAGACLSLIFSHFLSTSL